MSDEQIDGQDEGGIAALREAARKGADATKENAELHRRIAFLEAGIDLKSELGELLFQTWDGKDVNELVDKATRIGALKASTPPPQNDPAAERAAQERAAEDARRQAAYETAGTGSAPPPGVPQGDDPRTAALVGFRENLKNGMPEDEARIDAMAKVLAAAGAGDKRMFFDHERHMALGREADRIANTRG